MNKNIWWVLLIPGLLTGCGYFAVHFAPEKLPSKTRTHAAEQADDLFWKMLHSGQYDQIQTVLNALTTAYLKDQSDATTAAHIGWMHVWRFSEQARMTEIPATITDHAVLSRKYFEEAVRLNPDDARYLGFLGGLTVVEGSIHKDEKLVRKGYYILFDSIHAWPEFNSLPGWPLATRGILRSLYQQVGADSHAVEILPEQHHDIRLKGGNSPSSERESARFRRQDFSAELPKSLARCLSAGS